MTKRSFNHRSNGVVQNTATPRSEKTKTRKNPRVIYSQEIPFPKVPGQRTKNGDYKPEQPDCDAEKSEGLMNKLKSLPVSLETSSAVLELYQWSILENRGGLGIFLSRLRSAINTEIQKSKATQIPISKTMSEVVSETLHDLTRNAMKNNE